MFCLLVLTQLRHGKEGGAGVRRSIFILLGERAVGPRRCSRMGEEGGVCIDGFVKLFCPACVTDAAWLGLLACLRAGVV